MNAASSTTIAAAIKHCKTPKQLLQLHFHTINNPSLLQISSSPCLHLAPPTLLRLCNRLPQLCRRSLQPHPPINLLLQQMESVYGVPRELKN
ncbi:hypothetical protein TB2_014743 [Malus domestica]